MEALCFAAVVIHIDNAVHGNLTGSGSSVVGGESGASGAFIAEIL